MIYDAVIVGAGISGISLARRLESLQKKYLIVEKSKGIGGRMATRRILDSRFDHGAQFYKRSENTTELTMPGLELWFERDHENYYAHPLGMSGLAKTLINRENVQLDSFVNKLEFNCISRSWKISIQGLTDRETKILYLTCPVPQSLEILKNSSIIFDAELSSLTYSKAIIGLFRLQADTKFWHTFQLEENASSSILSISNQFSKRVSTTFDVVVTMNPTWSHEHFEFSEETLLNQVRFEFQKWMADKKGFRYMIDELQIKKWRYAVPEKTYASAYYQPPATQGLYLIGDGFGGPHISGAIHSGLEVPIHSEYGN